MYKWVVFVHVSVIFIFLIRHAAEIFVTFRLREQEQPEGIFATYSFLPNNNSRKLRITYSLIIITGGVAGFISPWWKFGWMWTALSAMIVIWIVMHRLGGNYLNAVDAITEQALKNKDQDSAVEIFRRELKARREPEVMTATAVAGMLIILWLMMFKPF